LGEEGSVLDDVWSWRLVMIEGAFWWRRMN